MNSFSYASPKTWDEAVKLLSDKWGETEILAGGTDLLSALKDYIVTPKTLVNIKGIDDRNLRTGLAGRPDGWVLIGALTPLSWAAESPQLARYCPALSQAAAGIRSPQILAMGTVGGDLLQRPRCWYFRNGHGLLATGPDGKSLVEAGDNRHHAIFGNDGPAKYVHPSSLAPALVALDAKFHIAGPGGRRTVSAAEFFRIPKADGERETVLKPNEILAEIEVGTQNGRPEVHNATYEVREKSALDWPLAAAAVALKMNGDTVASAKVVLGHVAPIPWVSKAAADALTGKKITPETAEAAGQAAVQGAKPLSRNGYKVQLAKTAVKRAILTAAGIQHGGF